MEFSPVSFCLLHKNQAILWHDKSSQPHGHSERQFFFPFLSPFVCGGPYNVKPFPSPVPLLPIPLYPAPPPSLTAPYRVGAVGSPAALGEGQGVGPRGRCGSRGTEVWEGGVGGRCGREVWEGGVRGVGGRCGTCGRCGWKGWELSVVARCGHPQSDWCTPSK